MGAFLPAVPLKDIIVPAVAESVVKHFGSALIKPLKINHLWRILGPLKNVQKKSKNLLTPP
jgi:hypothetical protein